MKVVEKQEHKMVFKPSRISPKASLWDKPERLFLIAFSIFRLLVNTSTIYVFAKILFRRLTELYALSLR